MIGVPVLDELSTMELIGITWGNIMIRVPEKQPIQLTVQDSPTEPQRLTEMSQSKIVTLCKMEIESRFGWLRVAEGIQKTKEDEGKTV